MFRKNLLAHTLALAFSGTAASLILAPTAFAQSNTNGSIFGRVEPGTGTAVLIENPATGLKRTITIGADGRFTATALPPGAYKASLLSGDKVKSTVELTVVISQGAEAVFASGTQTVEVSARRVTIDVSTSNNGANFSAKELAELPVGHNVSSIIQLAPNTTRADPRYAAGAVFGGGAASENAYYINGFPVTNPLTQLGASELPFGAIASAQVLTGGYGVEFGRSVGGVVNITTKSGTNEWEGGATLSWSPNALRAKQRDIYYPVIGVNNGQATPYASDGQLLRASSKNTIDAATVGAYLGGPLIKDTLFMFLAAETQHSKSGTVLSSKDWSGGPTADPQGWRSREALTDRYLAKFDWNINSDHSLELTMLGDRSAAHDKLSGFDYATLSHDGVVSSDATYTNLASATPVGGVAQILKYTGHVNQDFTIQALYGTSQVNHINSFAGYDPNQFQVVVNSNARAPGITYNSFAQVLSGTVLPDGSKDKVNSLRLDLEYQLGDHLLRGGLDDNKLKSYNAGERDAGGGIWNYRKTTVANAGKTTGVFAKQNASLASSGYAIAAQGYYVRRYLFDDATSAGSDQAAQYLEDQWQATRNLRLTFGIRNETYQNTNGDGVAFLKMSNQLNPRFGAAWDVNGDSSLKAFASAGRYAVQIPTHLAIRGASRSLNTTENFAYSGVDANGNPTGLYRVSDANSSNNEYGQAKDVRTVAAVGLKPTFQDELTLGFEKALTKEWNTGVKATYRNLRSTIDDFCDQSVFDTYAAAHGIAHVGSYFSCASFNPGRDNTFYVNYDGTGNNLQLVKITAAEFGFPKAQRTYFALDTFLEHPLKDSWYGRVNYTYSKAQGNTEGQTLSDVGQTDVSATQTWDLAPIMEYSYGRSLNDRTHQIKAYGFYQVTPEFGVGVNALAASGAPVACLGNHPNASPDSSAGINYTEYLYGSSFHYCGGYDDYSKVDADGNPLSTVPNTPAPRGKAGSLPWDVNFDLQLQYKPSFMPGILGKLEVFNLFNRQIATAKDPIYNSDTNVVSPTYKQTLSNTSPRSMKLTLEYNKKF